MHKQYKKFFKEDYDLEKSKSTLLQRLKKWDSKKYTIITSISQSTGAYSAKTIHFLLNSDIKISGKNITISGNDKYILNKKNINYSNASEKDLKQSFKKFEFNLNDITFVGFESKSKIHIELKNGLRFVLVY